MTRRKTILIVSIALLGIYTAGYGMARQGSWIVHNAGFYTDADQQIRVAGHSVAAGDFGIPALATRVSLAQTIVVTAYLPVRVLEKIVWSVVIPPGAPWPSDWKYKDI